MLRQVLFSKGIFLSNQQFSDVLDITTKDIKFNKIHFGHKTNLQEVIQIAERAASIIIKNQ